MKPGSSGRTSVTARQGRSQLLRSREPFFAKGMRAEARAGVAGVLTLDPPHEPRTGDQAFALAADWVSHTPYRPTRHAPAAADLAAAAAADLLAECRRRGLPSPEIAISRVAVGPRGGLQAHARLHFAVSLAGPILLGRDAHRGGGLFVGAR